jgi:uncharacterized alpha-E superfamily protein
MLSRVADSLYWMSRYLERAEHTARLVDVHLNLSLDQSHVMPPDERWERLLRGLRLPVPEGGVKDEYSITYLLAFDPTNHNSIVSCISTARENARQVREKISSEMWMHLNRLYLDLKSADMERIWNEQPHEFFRAVKDGAHLFQGITDSTIVRDEGWQFIQLGRYIERGISIASLLDVYMNSFEAMSDAPLAMDEYFEWLGLLKCFTAFEAYCKVYNADLRAQRIIEFLLLSAEFPHAIRFCAEQLHTALQIISDSTLISKNSRVYRLAGRLRSELSFDQLNDILAEGVHEYLVDIRRQCTHIHASILETYITYAVESALN